MNIFGFQESKKAAFILTRPSYLREITRANNEIYLCYDQQELTEIKLDKPDISADNTNVSFDLTGNPLEVDLDTEVEAVVDAEVHLWSDEENLHFPLELKVARNEVNKMLSTSSGDNTSYGYVYAICKITNKSRQVLLGASKCNNVFNRVQVFIEGVYAFTDDRISMNSMKIEHCKNAEIKDFDSDMDTFITATYIIFGQRKTSPNVQLVSGHSGSILVELSWTIPQYSIPDYEKSIRMDTQVIVGHQGSQLHILWEQLLLLESLITLLSQKSGCFDSVSLSDNPTDSYKISVAICELLANTKMMRPRLLKAHFKIFREEEFIDRLWALLNDCGSVDDIRSCLHDLFKELVEYDSSLQLNIPFHNTSCIARIIQELATGKLAVPTLSHARALECLIELGIEKLKSDYFHILAICDCLNIAEAADLWKSLTNGSASVLPNDLRRTMLSGATAVGNLEWTKKLNCLLKMHTACDLLVLAKTSKCLPPILIYNIKNSLLCENLRMDSFSGIKGFKHEVDVEIGRDDLKDVKLDTPVAWNIKFESKIDSSYVTTIFNHNSRPIFPSVVFDDYEIPVTSAAESIYYVTKFVEYSEHL